MCQAEIRPGALRISSDKRELDVDAIHAFLHDHAPWSLGIPREVVQQSIDGSLCFGAFLGETFVGFARLVTDLATFAYLCDVFVLPEHRGQGHARTLIDQVFADPRVSGLRRIALVTSDAHGLYAPAGFVAPAHPERWMELHRPEVYRRT
ncbi:GNAT family N-acetyltransferase [Burkholderia gladioli]|uniref:GNAT family N-acetyltransferase n=1 Tax=Burkholderia gladioli TaxID=28095 RepID=UPI000649C5BB